MVALFHVFAALEVEANLCPFRWLHHDFPEVHINIVHALEMVSCGSGHLGEAIG
jgi:hypothetical protein